MPISTDFNKLLNLFSYNDTESVYDINNVVNWLTDSGKFERENDYLSPLGIIPQVISAFEICWNECIFFQL